MEEVDELKKGRDLIETSQTISVFASEKNRENLTAALGLLFSLKKIGKKVNLINSSLPREYSKKLSKFGIFFGGADFLISIKERKTKVSQLFYEKTETETKIYLKSEGGVNPKDIKFDIPEQSELLIVLGDFSPKTTDSLYNFKGNIININNHFGGVGGDVNIIRENYSLSEIVFDFLKTFHKIDPLSKKFLLGGIIKKIIEENELRLETENKIRPLLGRNLNLFLTLSERINQENHFVWGELKRSDIKNSKAISIFLPFTPIVFPEDIFLLLWEEKAAKRGVIRTPGRNKANKIHKRLGGQQKNNWILFNSRENIMSLKNKIFFI